MRTGTLAEVCSLVTDGTHYTPPDVGSGVPFLTVKDVSDSALDFMRSSRISQDEYGKADAGQSAPKLGDVLFSKDGTVGKVHVVRTDQPFAVLSSLAILRPDAKQIDSGYLGHALRSPMVIGQATKRKTGSAVRRIILSDLKQISFPVPPLDEQRRIAAILDQADALRAKRREALAHLDDLTQSIFLDMFVRGGSAEWPHVSIGEIAAQRKGSIRTGPFGSQLLHSEFVEEGVAVLGIDNVVSNEFMWRERRFITEQKYAQLSRYTVHPGDVLVTIMGTCGRCAVVPDDITVAINTKHLCCITLDTDRCLPEFMQANFLRHPMARAYLQRTAKGAIMSGLNMAIIKEMPLALPPLGLQERFSQRIEAIQDLRKVHQSSAEELKCLFASLQSRAFAGEL